MLGQIVVMLEVKQILRLKQILHTLVQTIPHNSTNRPQASTNRSETGTGFTRVQKRLILQIIVV